MWNEDKEIDEVLVMFEISNLCKTGLKNIKAQNVLTASLLLYYPHILDGQGTNLATTTICLSEEYQKCSFRFCLKSTYDILNWQYFGGSYIKPKTL